MDIAQLRTFVAAAESGSFSAAAAVVHASTSSVTERIASLERRIGSRLFSRSRNGCTLTDAGARFLPRAQAILAGWALAKDEAALPARFSGQINIGAQYALWPELLIPWVESLQAVRIDLAFALSAGASARMNREVAAGTVDLAILYNPVLGGSVEACEVVNDRLVMVCSSAAEDWRAVWVDIDWGEAMRAPIAEATDYLDGQGLRLDLGGLALHWLVQRSGAGYVPERLARRYIADGSVREITDVPPLDYPAFALWRRDSRFQMHEIVAHLTAFVEQAEGLNALAHGMDAPGRGL